VQDKTEGGQPVRLILGYRRFTITVAAVYDRRSRFSGGPAKAGLR
jgi:hypothetical protein